MKYIFSKVDLSDKKAIKNENGRPEKIRSSVFLVKNVGNAKCEKVLHLCLKGGFIGLFFKK